MSNYLVLINDFDILDKVKELGYTNFLFALKEYSIGYNDFTIDEIGKIDGNKYLLINRILNSTEIRVLENILINLTNINGLVFEDLGILEIVKTNHLDLELIYFHNHAGTNYETINFWLNEGIDSVVLSNEITAEEINEIQNNVIKPVSIIVLGHNQIMYSRRTLLTNYAKYHGIPNQNRLSLTTNNIHFDVVESEYGTVFYTKNIYNYFNVLNDNFKYAIVNLTLINNEDSIKVLSDIKNNKYSFDYLETSDGFLKQKTIFKLGVKNNG